MKIRKLQLKNIGVFDDETIEFQPCPAKDKAEIHILTGQNGSGKSTILMALAGMFDYTEERSSLGFKHFEYLRNSLYKRYRLFGFEKEHYLSEAIVYFHDGDKITLYGCSECKFVHQRRLYTHKSEESVHRKLDLYRYLLTSKFPSTVLDVFSTLELDFAAFAYSGYRRIKDKKINLFDEIEENPLNQALDFIKDENSKFTINQWLGRNLSKRALALEDNSEEGKKFTENVKNLEKVIADIVGYNIRFKLKTDLSLVLVKDNQELDFDILPDGLKSLISWIGDLLMRLDSLDWKDDTPIFDREIILFLDEIEVHLHPAWQRKVLPVVQKLFKNSQIFVSTHSPFVVNSVDDAWVYKLELENGKAKVSKPIKSEDGISYQTVLSEIFGVDEEFGGKTQEDLDKFYKIVRNGKEINEKELLKLAKSLAVQSDELNSIVQIELRQLNRKKGMKLNL